MMHLSITLKLIISVLLGSAVGLERQAYERKIDPNLKSGIGSLGVRSYALITALGTAAALLYKQYSELFLFISITFAFLLIAYYILGSLFTRDSGITTELAIFWSYLIGVFIGLETFPIQIIIAMAVFLIVILSLKEEIRIFVAGIKEFELDAFISYAIIVLIILPFLPDKSFTLKQIPLIPAIFSAYNINLGKFLNIELFNLFSVWKVVAIITGVEILGYLLEKTVGQKKGWLLTSLAGGFISSTSTIQSLSQQSKKSKNINKLTAAAIFANFSSFIQHFILIASINPEFLVKNTLYISSLLITALLIGVYYIRKKSKHEDLRPTKKVLKKDKIFSIKPALQFALLFLSIKLTTKLALAIFGNTGFIIGNLLGAITGLDAVTINVSELAGKNISYFIGVFTLIMANAVNLLSKALYTFIHGNREFAKRFSISAFIIIVASFIGLIPLL